MLSKTLTTSLFTVAQPLVVSRAKLTGDEVGLEEKTNEGGGKPSSKMQCHLLIAAMGE